MEWHRSAGHRHRPALVFPGPATILKTARTLMGQRRGIPSSNDTGGLYAYTHFLPGVFEMTWNGENYQAGPPDARCLKT
jgi:hypothetical protein